MTITASPTLEAPALHVLVLGADEEANGHVARTVARIGGFVASTPTTAELSASGLFGVAARAAVVVVGFPTDEATRNLCLEAVEAHIPVVAIASLRDVPHGVCAAGADASPEYVVGLLRGMIARQATVDDLLGRLERATSQDAPLRSEMHRLQDELALAASVQREFLPRTLPAFGEWATAALWRPASYVSGDIYNAFRADEHHLAIFLLDAVGHGVPAALLTLVLARALPVKRIEPGAYRLHSPAEALTLLNAEMVTHTGRNARFATAAYALIDLRTGRARVATAGHPAPLHLRSGRGMESIPSAGPILGILEDAEFQEAEVELGQGDGLLLYTDGFEHLYPKAHPTLPGAMLPTDRYLDLFAEAAGRGAAPRIVECVDSAIERACGGLPLIDDVTLVALTRSRSA